MFLVMIVSLLMVSGSCFAFDWYGDSNFVAKQLLHHQHQKDALMTQIVFITSCVSVASAMSGFYMARLCATNHPLKNRLNTCYKVANGALVLCVGAYAGYQIPTEVWQTTGDVEKAFLAGILAEIGSTCIGAVAGTLSS